MKVNRKNDCDMSKCVQLLITCISISPLIPQYLFYQLQSVMLCTHVWLGLSLLRSDLSVTALVKGVLFSFVTFLLTHSLQHKGGTVTMANSQNADVWNPPMKNVSISAKIVSSSTFNAKAASVMSLIFFSLPVALSLFFTVRSLRRRVITSDNRWQRLSLSVKNITTTYHSSGDLSLCGDPIFKILVLVLRPPNLGVGTCIEMFKYYIIIYHT